jgi:PASTA domain
MAVYARALLPRILVISAVWITASGTLTFAADKTLTTSHPAAKPPVATPRPILVVPDVRSQAFVFAKGILDDNGFAWRVVGSVEGYATNRVVSQTPAPGARVVDTGAPTIALQLARGSYGQNGTPENTSPYAGTSIVPAVAAKVLTKKPAAARVPLAPVKVAKAKKVAKTKKVAKAKKIVKAHKLSRVHKPALKKTARAASPKARRPAAFAVPGAPKEPLDEISLPARARLLDAWLTSSRGPTAANERHWLYQHAWIVTGARFGWWHGAAALRVLISVDRRIESLWGVGHRSELVARNALAAVEARAK